MKLIAIATAVAVASTTAVAFASIAALASPMRGPSQDHQAPAATAVPGSSFDVMEQSIEDLQHAMDRHEVTSRQLVDLYLARIEQYDGDGPALNAIKTVNPHAREEADALDGERAGKGPRGPLHGIPVLVKDNYETIDMPTTAGSIALATFHPKRDATLVERLKAAGAVILAKTNMHELAAGITSVGSGFGEVRNPYDLTRTPGGSSGGTGAAVAANFGVAGFGTDTCGSIRYPAAENNLVGLRGTQGLSSRSGIVPLSLTQDIGGPIARSVADLAILLDATAGPDTADASTTAGADRRPASYRQRLTADALRGARIGIVRSLFGSAPDDEEVAGIVQKAVTALKAAGAEVVDVSIPGLDDLLRGSSMINADFKFDLADYLAKAGDAPVRSLGDILDRGLYHTALEATFRTRNAVPSRDTDESRRARAKRAALRAVIDATFAEHQIAAMVYPALRRKSARLGEGQGPGNCQVSAGSGLPALSVPAGFTDDGLPIGMELLGRAFDEPTLLSIGYGAELTLKLRRPPFSTPALVNGRRPQPRKRTITFQPAAMDRNKARPPVVVLDLTYDETAARLDYSFRIDARLAAHLDAVWIHGGTVEKPGAARYKLFSRGQPLTGHVAIPSVERDDLRAGRSIVRFYLTDVAGSAGDFALTGGVSP